MHGPPEDEFYWLWWSSEFSGSTTVRCLSEDSSQLQLHNMIKAAGYTQQVTITWQGQSNLDITHSPTVSMVLTQGVLELPVDG